MRDEGTWLRELFDPRSGHLGRAFGGKHRVARMLRFGHRHASPALKRRLVRAQQRHEKGVHARMEANALRWGQAVPGRGAPKKPRDRKPWKRQARKGGGR